VTLALPDFPWDALAPAAETARRHPDGVVDLSVGSPIDPTPEVVRAALAEATDAHSYPQVAGTPALRAAIVDWYRRRRDVDLGESCVLPTIGSKELVASLPLQLGVGPGDVVVQPTLAYPTYAVGALLVGASVVSADDPAEWPEGTRLVWVNSPSNPDGRVAGAAALRDAVSRARELGAVLVADECYAELVWDSERPSTCILHPDVVGDDRRGVLSCYSLSKQSNLAGYRAAFIAGDAELVARLLAVRKHLGAMPPAPVQAAMVAALADDDGVAVQRERYRRRRDELAPALTAAGFRIDDSTGGLYLWATADEDCWASVDRLARLGVLVTPGSFYGERGARHVRVSLTASDERVTAAATRLHGAVSERTAPAP